MNNSHGDASRIGDQFQQPIPTQQSPSEHTASEQITTLPSTQLPQRQMPTDDSVSETDLRPLPEPTASTSVPTAPPVAFRLQQPQVGAHRHQSGLRGVKVTPRPSAADPSYTAVHYAYAGRTGSIHEVITIDGRELAKVGFSDRKIVYYLLSDLERDTGAVRRTFHDESP